MWSHSAWSDHRGTVAGMIDPRAFRDTAGTFLTGVTVVMVRDGDEVRGMTANAFLSVSLDPPLVLVSVRREARILPHLRAAGRWAVSILAEDQEADALRFAGQAVDGPAPLLAERAGMPVLAGAIATLAARTTEIVEAGDHLVFLGEVIDLWLSAERTRPLAYHRGVFGRLASRPGTPSVEPLEPLDALSGNWA